LLAQAQYSSPIREGLLVNSVDKQEIAQEFCLSADGSPIGKILQHLSVSLATLESVFVPACYNKDA
jgi:hypothetical protein